MTQPRFADAAAPNEVDRLVRFLKLFVPLTLMLVGLPLVGVLVVGKPLAPYFEFPPRTEFMPHEDFAWWAFVSTAVLVAAAVAPFVVKIAGARLGDSDASARTGPFPWWGWAGVAWLALAWWLAWSRFPWFAAFQSFTFSPLWVGYIVIVNALTWRRTGRCMLVDRTGYFLALFPASAAFWWLFEYLNRFVQNWFYMGVGTLGAWDYFWQATLPFSTVLPAVLGTRELIASCPRLSAGLHRAWAVPRLRAPGNAILVLAVAAAGLALIGVWPDGLFPLLWLAPLGILVALQVLMGEPSILDGPTAGDWSGIWQAALAGLVCGFFWEMWNYGSLAHWRYSVPYVHAFEVFHMPLLGYSGYLPFGIECLAVGGLVKTLWPRRVRA